MPEESWNPMLTGYPLKITWTSVPIPPALVGWFNANKSSFNLFLSGQEIKVLLCAMS
jgi:hypothetical protein